MARKISSMQTLYYMIINILISKPLALPLAKSQTLICMIAKFRLRIESILVAFANEKPLYFNHLASTRLHHRLQICQLSALTSLQVQVVSFAVCKEKFIENQGVYLNSFAGLFANNSN